MALQTNKIVSATKGFDALYIYDEAGELLSCCEKGPEIAAAIDRNLQNMNNLSNATWLPEAIKKEISDSQESKSWNFKIAQGDLELFETFIWLLKSKETQSQIIVHFDWLWKRNQDSRNIRLHLLQMARLASVGGLGGALAHALNNPLATIRGFAEVLKRRFEQFEKVGYFSDKIVANADRMKLIIDGMRQLSRPNSLFGSQSIVDLNATVEGTARIMEEQFKMRNIALETKLAPDLMCIHGDPTLWESLFLSLFAISRDSFQLQNDEKKKIISIQTFMSNGHVGFCYLDNAGGLPAVSDAAHTDALSLLQDNDSSIGLPGFVVLEVLRRHHAQVYWKVNSGDSSEIRVELADVAERPAEDDLDMAI